MAKRAIDLFAGFGGSTTGLIDAGWDVVLAANHWRLALDTHELNHPDVPTLCQDLQQADFSTFPECDLVWASPSCLERRDRPPHRGARARPRRAAAGVGRVRLRVA